MNNTALILVGFDLEKTQRAINFLNQSFSNVVDTKILILNHSGFFEHRTIINTNDWIIIKGSNQQSEFSGWQEGLDFLKKTRTVVPAVIFANDTINSHRIFTGFRLRAFIKTITGSSKKHEYIGFTDRTPSNKVFSINGVEFNFWVSTYLFYLTAGALKRIEFMILDEGIIKNSIRETPDPQQFFGNNISTDLKEYLANWLFKDGWYAAKPLCDKTFPELTLKARSIISEKWLTARALANDVSVTNPFEKHLILKKMNTLTVISSLCCERLGLGKRIFNHHPKQ